MKHIYLDYAAATPVLPAVAEVMKPYLSEKFYNPSATYLAGRSIRDDVEAARGRVARWFGARPAEVVFTAGGTEANNLAVHGIMRLHPQAHMVTTAVEHESVLAPASQYVRTVAPVRPDGIVDAETLKSALRDDTVLVSVMYANNEIGTVQPLRRIASILEEVRAERAQSGNQLPLYFHTDAAQAGNYLDLHASRLGVDLMTVNSGKIYGPKQAGCLYVRAGIKLQPLIQGGGQEQGLRSGTENVAAVVGFAEALDTVQAGRREETARLQALQELFYQRLADNLPRAAINGSTRHRLPNNVHVTLPGQDNERLMMALDERGIQAAVGSACSASKEEPSHVLAAIGLSNEQARSSLRFSLGRPTREADVLRAVAALAESAG